MSAGPTLAITLKALFDVDVDRDPPSVYVRSAPTAAAGSCCGEPAHAYRLPARARDAARVSFDDDDVPESACGP